VDIIGEAGIRIRPDTKDFERETESRFGSIAKKAAAVFAGAFAVREGFDFVKKSVEAAAESNKIAAQTAAVIKSTGGAAKVSTADVDKLATSLSNLTGIDDEAIEKGENLLLTFTNVRNEAGKGNDIFNQATSILADMSVALGTDVSSSAIQLGKALNDPIKGVTALQRVGVSFTQSQKDQIETLVKTGHALDAQKIILKELTTEFGGSAEAVATPIGKLKVQLGNIQEQIGNAVLPVLNRMAEFMSAHLPAAIDATSRAIGRVVTPIRDFIGGFREGTDKIGAAQTKAAVFGAVLFEKVNPPVKFLGEFVRDTLLPALDGLAEHIGTNLVPILEALAAAFAAIKVVNFVQVISELVGAMAAAAEGGTLLEGAIALIGGPITIVIAAVAALTAGIVIAYQKSQTFRDIVHAVGDAFVAFGRTLEDVVGAIGRFGQRVIEFVGGSGPVGFLRENIAALTEFWRTHWDEIKQIFQGALDLMVSILRPFADQLANTFRILSDIVVPLVTLAWESIRATFTIGFDFIVGLVRIGWDQIAGIFRVARDLVLGIIGTFLDLLTGHWSRAFNTIKQTVINIFNDIRGTIENVIRSILTTAENLVGDFTKAGIRLAQSIIIGITNGIKALVGDVKKAIEGVINDAIDILPGPAKSVARGIFHVARQILGSGGIVAGPVGSPQLVIAHGGELVIPAALTQALVSGRAVNNSTASTITIGDGAVQVNVAVQGSADRATVEAFRTVARDEIGASLRRIIDHAVAGTGRAS